MYIRIRPHRALTPFVESIGIQESPVVDNLAARTRILPTATMRLLFHYGDAFVQFKGNGTVFEPATYLTGQRTSPLEVCATGTTGIVIVSFYPWGLSAFSDIPAHRICDTSCDLLDLGFRTSEVSDRLREVCTASKRLLLIQDWLLAHLKPAASDELVRHAVLILNESFGGIAIEALARSLGISKRQLDRRFNQVVGVSPKTFARLIRFQKALFFINTGKSLVEVASTSGYHDQSHMHRDFRQFAGLSPERVFKDREQTPLMKNFNLGALSHFYNTTYLH